jgi:hypothetical protein
MAYKEKPVIQKKKGRTGRPYNVFLMHLQTYSAFVTTLAGNSQLLATTLATSRQYSTPFYSGHTLTESMLVTALGVRRLVGTLTHDSNF